MMIPTDRIENLEREVMAKINDNPEIAKQHFEGLKLTPGTFRKKPPEGKGEQINRQRMKEKNLLPEKLCRIYSKISM